MVDEGRAIRKDREGHGRAGGRVPSAEMEDPGRKDGVWLGHMELGGLRGRHSMHAAGCGDGYCRAGPALPLCLRLNLRGSYYFCLDFGLK